MEDATRKELQSACSDVRVLQEELPDGSLDDLSTSCFQKVLAFWNDFAKVKLQESKVSLRSVEALLSEAALTYPFKEEINDATLKLGEMLRSASAEAKLTNLMAVLEKQYNSDTDANFKDQGFAQTLLQAGREADGVEMNDDQVILLDVWWKKVAQQWCSEPARPLVFEATWLDVFWCLATWLPDEQATQNELASMDAWHKLREALHNLQGGHADVTAMLENDEKYDKLTELQAKFLLASKVPEKAWNYEALQKLRGEVQNLMDQAAMVILQWTGAKLDKCNATTSMIAGSPEHEGELWHYGLKKTASWEEVCNKAKGLLAVPAATIEETQLALEKACSYHDFWKEAGPNALMTTNSKNLCFWLECACLGG